MTAVTAAIQQKDNEHALALMKMRTANKRELQKMSQALATLSNRVDGIAIREGNKGDSRDKKAESAATTATEAAVVETTTPVSKMTTNKIMPTAATKSGYTQKAWNTIPHGPIRRGNGSTKRGTWMTKK